MRRISIIILTAIAAGCASEPKTVYVACDRRIESCTNRFGVACKAVPDVVFAEMLVRMDELKELKKERKVEARMGK